MFALIQHIGILLAVCVVIGVATSWWVFRGDRGRPVQKKPTNKIDANEGGEA